MKPRDRTSRLKAAVNDQARAYILPNSSNKKVQVTRRSREALEDWRWRFSFRFWSQIEYFGLDSSDISNRWFVSVLERLKVLSAEPIDRVHREPEMRAAMRFHRIDWHTKGIPITKADLPDLPLHYRDDPEYDLYQFQISKGTGRVVGFFDENWVFNVVLLDPLHNLQPSKHYDYSVDPCSPLSCEITNLRENIKTSIAKCEFGECSAAKTVSDLAHEYEKRIERFDVLIVKLCDQSVLQMAKELVAKGEAESLAKIFEEGVLVLSRDH